MGYITRMHDGNLVDIFQIFTLRDNVTHCVTMVCERKNLDSKMTLENVNFTFQMSKFIFKGVKTFTEHISDSVHFVRSLQESMICLLYFHSVSKLIHSYVSLNIE